MRCALAKAIGTCSDMGRVEAALTDMIARKDPGLWSSAARTLASRAIADTLAIGAAGTREGQTTIARASLLPSTHPDAVPVWAGTLRYPLADAAFFTGVACHSLDWDDYMHPMHGHCSSVLLPVAWTIAEHTGASGSDLIDGFLTGYQVDYLSSLAFGNEHYKRGWHATSTVGALGAAATAARMLGLSVEQSAHALALAASFASGIRANFGTPTKALHAGAAARHGIQAAQLALAGATGNPDWFLGSHGMLATFGGELDATEAEHAITRAVNGKHGIETGWGLVQKSYCCCGSCHSAVEGVIALATEFDLVPADIQSLRIHVDPLIPAIMQVDVPADPFEARYSPSWVMAVSAIDRAAGPAQFSIEALQRPDVHRLRQRVVVVDDLETTDDDRFAARVEIQYNGQLLTREVWHSIGHPKRPMSESARKQKLRDALAGVMSDSISETLIAAIVDVDSLPQLSAVGDLIRRSLASSS
jgi:2-methylcitrate dehydratase PrpD